MIFIRRLEKNWVRRVWRVGEEIEEINNLTIKLIVWWKYVLNERIFLFEIAQASRFLGTWLMVSERVYDLVWVVSIISLAID